MILFRGIKFKRIEGIALWPFVLVRGLEPTKNLLRHERIHLRQQSEMLVIPFYIWYALEWLIRLTYYRNAHLAYMNISFEREAYTNEKEEDFLENRKFWNFVHYLWI